ncbi:MAG TPA: LysM peptidoglycan-binding domain-containing protein [Anaerolineae bacterium]|nr:LysM peptidoglycan-binding domain-containing protein [Anaerolineae bacterium]HXK43675.1 LysM peptidoglycan-binding domain-containing protein [Anaerolineae bacterium]
MMRGTRKVVLKAWKWVLPVMVLVNLLVLATPAAAQGTSYVVQPGDTLYAIARRYGISVNALAAANGLTTRSWIYVGQSLTLPDAGTAPAPAPAPTPATTGIHIVQPGENLFRLGLRYGTTAAAIRAANGLSSDLIYVGQRLVIPGAGGGVPPITPSPAPVQGAPGEKWIDINLSRQTLTAYVGQTPVFTAVVSTGTSRTPTVVGTYSIYVKYLSTPMSGPGYYLPNVPYTMYFYRGYGIHGTYWHNNFGTPMSHGCVNMRTSDAQWLYNWAPVGTKVVTHY